MRSVSETPEEGMMRMAEEPSRDDEVIAWGEEVHRKSDERWTALYPEAAAYIDRAIEIQRRHGMLRHEPTPEKREEAIRGCVIIADRVHRHLYGGGKIL